MGGGRRGGQRHRTLRANRYAVVVLGNIAHTAVHRVVSIYGRQSLVCSCLLETIKSILTTCRQSGARRRLLKNRHLAMLRMAYVLGCNGFCVS